MKQVEGNVKGEKDRMIKNILLINKIYKKRPLFQNYVLWVRRNAEVKNPLAFIRLCKNLDPEINKIMICNFNEGNFIAPDEIEDECKNIDNFILIKNLDYFDSQVYFKYAKVHINTSHFEGFPNTFVQAFYEGVPIVSLNFNVDNFINDAECGLFADSNENKFKTYVELLYRNKERWEFFSKKAKEFYKNEFDFKSNIDSLEQCMK